MINAACSPPENAPTDQLAADGQLPGTAAPTLDTQGGSALTSFKYLQLMIGTGLGLLTARAGLGCCQLSVVSCKTCLGTPLWLVAGWDWQSIATDH